MSHTGWIAIDLDGTLAKYESWISVEHIGDPIPAMVDRVRQLIAKGYEVRIMTARVSENRPSAEIYAALAAIQKWTKLHVGVELAATCKKDYAMIALYDDRAISVEPNTGKLLAPDFILGEKANAETQD